MTERISLVGFVTVSLRRSITALKEDMSILSSTILDL